MEETGSGLLEVIVDPPAGEGLSWLGEGASLRFRDATAVAPMTYCSAGTTDEREASCIYTRMEVRLEKGLDDVTMGYWPAYSEMKPHQRGYYLRWLTAGRKGPLADIGYAFVYFYGLERRALLERRDVFRIIEEVERLLGIYNGSRSFQKHAGRFLLYLHAKYLNDPHMTEKRLADLYRLLPPSEEAMVLRLLLGYRALQNRPLSAEQAFNLLRHQTARGRKTKGREGGGDAFFASTPPLPPGLKGLFTHRYHQVFPRGFSLTASFDGSKQHSVTYSVASGALALTQNIKSAKSPEPAIVPNVFGKGSGAAGFKKLRALYDACIEDARVGECSGFAAREDAGKDGKDGPVVVRPAGKRPPGEPLPLIRVDMKKVEALQEETESLAQELAAVFASEEGWDEGKASVEAFDSFDSSDSPPGPLIVSEREEESGHFPATEFPSLPFREDALRSLPRRCWACVGALLERPAWSKEEFTDLARRHNSMPNALLEDLNTWSIETLGDFLLLEEKGGWVVNRDLVTGGER